MNDYKFPIVMFHRVEDQGYMNKEGIYISGEHSFLEAFKEKCQRLKSDFRVFHLCDLVELIKSDVQIPKNAAAITFDDGTRDQIEIALPVLLELNLPATFSVMTAPFEGKIPETFKMQLITGGKIEMGDLAENIFPKAIVQVSERFSDMYKNGIEVPPQRFIGEKHQTVRQMKYLVNYLLPSNLKSSLIEILFQKIFGDFVSGVEEAIARKMFFVKDDLLRLVDCGMDIACHSHSHFNLATLPDDQLRNEVVESRKKIAEICHQLPQGFSFPSGGEGSYTNANVKFVRKNFEFALITGNQKTWVTPGHSLYELPRVHETNF